MWIAIAIVAVIALAVIGLLVTGAVAGHHRSAEPRDARARRGRRPARASPRPPPRPTSERRRGEAGEAPRRAPTTPAGHRVGRLRRPRAACRRRPRGLRAGRPRGARGHPAAVLQPVDPRRLGLGLGAFGVAVLGLPVAGREQRLRRQDRRRLGGRRQHRHRRQDAVLQRHRQDLHRRLPEGRPPEGEEGVGVHAADHRRAWKPGFVALYQKCVHLGCRVPWCQSSQWFECPCHGSKYNRVGEKVGGPAPRGLDRFVLEVSGGNIVVDTGNLVLGPPIGTEHHQPEPRRAALCLTPTDRPPRALEPDRHEFPHHPDPDQRRGDRRLLRVHRVPRPPAAAQHGSPSPRTSRPSSTTTCSRAPTSSACSGCR